MQCDDWETRRIYELPPNDLLDCEAFFSAFGRRVDVNGHNVEAIKTRPKSALLHAIKGIDGLDLADTVLILRSSDIAGVTPGESIRVEGALFRIISVSNPIRSVTRLDLQGVEA